MSQPTDQPPHQAQLVCSQQEPLWLFSANATSERGRGARKIVGRFGRRSRASRENSQNAKSNRPPGRRSLAAARWEQKSTLAHGAAGSAGSPSRAPSPSKRAEPGRGAGRPRCATARAIPGRPARLRRRSCRGARSWPRPSVTAATATAAGRGPLPCEAGDPTRTPTRGAGPAGSTALSRLDSTAQRDRQEEAGIDVECHHVPTGGAEHTGKTPAGSRGRHQSTPSPGPPPNPTRDHSGLLSYHMFI